MPRRVLRPELGRAIGGPGPRLAGALAIGLGMAGLFWALFSEPFPLSEFCSQRSGVRVLRLFERVRHPAVSGEAYVLGMGAVGLAYLAALRLARGLRGGHAALVLLGVVPLGLLLVLVPGLPVLSKDIYKYVFDGRILAIYGQNPFVQVPAEFPRDPFYNLIDWKTTVNAHGPIWRVAEAGAALAGGERCHDAILAMKVWPALAYLGTTAALFAMLRAWQPERAIWGTMVYAWNPLVSLEALQNGHNDVVAALPMLLAVWLVLRGQARWAFPMLAVAALVKPLALALGPLLLVAALRQGGSRREAVWGIGHGAGLVVLAYLPFWAGLATLQGLARGHVFTTSPATVFLGSLEGAGLAPDHAMLIASAAATGLFLVGFVALLRAVWSGRLPFVPAALGVLFLYLLVGAQAFHPWYLLWLAPLAALVAEGPPRALGVAFTLLGPLVYLFQHRPLPVVLWVFLPMALLAVWWRAWLGWPGLVGTAATTGRPSPIEGERPASLAGAAGEG